MTGICPLLGQPFKCLEDGCAWWEVSLDPPRCAVRVIAFRLLPLEALDEASMLSLEVQEHVKRIKELEENMRDLEDALNAGMSMGEDYVLLAKKEEG